MHHSINTKYYSIQYAVSFNFTFRYKNHQLVDYVVSYYKTSCDLSSINTTFVRLISLL